MPTLNINTHGFKEMWSMYLFNQFDAPIGDKLLLEDLIRKNELKYDDKTGTYFRTDTQSDKVIISAKDFMKDSAGKYINGANFGVINNFFEPI